MVAVRPSPLLSCETEEEFLVSIFTSYIAEKEETGKEGDYLVAGKMREPDNLV